MPDYSNRGKTSDGQLELSNSGNSSQTVNESARVNISATRVEPKSARGGERGGEAVGVVANLPRPRNDFASSSDRDGLPMPSVSGVSVTENREENNTVGGSSTEPLQPPPKRARQMRLTAPYRIIQKAGDEALLDLITIDMQPLQIVENEGFIAYSKKLNPDYVLPSRKKLTEMMEEKYNICSSEAKQKLQSVEYIALTTDIWTSDSQKSYISVTAHFIENSKLQSLIIATSELADQHTSLNIANALRNILNEWNIFEKIVTIVTDNASSMKKAIKDFLNKRNHFCVAHTINLAVKDCIQAESDVYPHLKNSDVINVISKSRAIVTHFKQSTKSSNALREMQTQMNLEIIKLKQDVQTRWNSTFYMLQRLLRAKVPLSATLPLLTSPPPSLNSEDWLIIEDCVALLQPMEKVTSVLSGESYPTLSCIIPIVRGLQSSIQNKSPKTEAGRHVQRSLLEVIDRRLSVYESNRTAAKATLLDPRFKKKGFGVESNAENAVKFVLEECAQYLAQDQPLEKENQLPTTSTAQTSTDDEIWDFLDKN
ncbi:hypothetical protein HF086_006953 [Spodoptera exigua]|uniref:Uncharacterized protein n=1 Tax=Spodoptera exigua TaxID=7107 RepID=A0A922SHG4_SPOEX|nr:hypothetical protein HF086_006953 [Spodoptera exigua]